jgi:hypothetical protein
MGEAAVVMEQLTPGMIAQGADLVARMEQKHVTIFAAFWLLSVETGAWHLDLACPEVETVGPLVLYKKARSCIADIEGVPEIRLDRISIVNPRDPAVVAIASLISSGSAQPERRVTNRWSNGQPVDDAYIYKSLIQPPHAARKGRRAAA